MKASLFFAVGKNFPILFFTLKRRVYVGNLGDLGLCPSSAPLRDDDIDDGVRLAFRGAGGAAIPFGLAPARREAKRFGHADFTASTRHEGRSLSWEGQVMDDERAIRTNRAVNSSPGDEAGDPSRVCGECNACCVRLAIPAGLVGASAKAECQPCPLLGRRGCSIYPARPTICRDFACTWWKRHDWPPEWRPDRIGLLSISEVVGGTLLGALIYELRPGALRTEAGATLLARLTATCDFVVTVTESGTRQLTPGLRFDPGDSPRRAPHFSRAALGTAATPDARPSKPEDTRC